MKHLFIFGALFLMFSLTAVSCGEDEVNGQSVQLPDGGGTSGGAGDDAERDTTATGDGAPVEGNAMTVEVGGRTFAATLADNETAEAFAGMLPLTLDMSELNGNEKYYYMDGSLPVNRYNPGTINAGDIMLYGSDCVVLFYGTFNTSYSYTNIGRIDNPEGLAEALGDGNVTVTFSRP